MNVSANVTVIVLSTNIEFFPSNEITEPVSSRTQYSSYTTKEFSFILKPILVGEHPIEVQLWWNKTKVDSELLILRTYDIVNPSIHSFYIRFLIAFLVPIYTFIVVQLYNPKVKFYTTDKSGKTTETSKQTILVFLTFLYWVIGISLLINLDTYYSLIPYLLPSIGRIEGVLAIGIIISAFCWLFFLVGKYDMSIRVSYIIIIFLFFSLVWDWILFPMPYLGLFEPLVKFLASTLIVELLRFIFKRITKKD